MIETIVRMNRTSTRIVVKQRIVHQLREHEADLETSRASEGLSRALGDGFDVRSRTIGNGGDFRDVATATAQLRRGVMDVDVIHAFGGAALAAAALGTRRAIVFSPAPQTRAKTIHWLRAVMAYRSVEVVCATATQRRRMIERGVALERCHVIRPGVEFSRVKRRRDAELRNRLGLSDRDRVYLAAGES